ncbi:MAG TPA: nitroreductase family deazaflavin-dependent oxidoreductase [Anaerolineae bacterium]
MSDQKEYNRQLIEEFRTTRDSPGGPLNGRPVVLLTTTGAKSGQRRTTPMMSIFDENRLIVIASNAGAPVHPDWYRNLVANPSVTVEVGTETYDAIAVVLEGAQRSETWARVVARYPFFAEHQAKVSRQIPVVLLERQKR